MHYLSIFLIGMASGLLLELLLTILWEKLQNKPIRINHKFTLGKKISLLSLPIWGIFAVFVSTQSYSLVRLFVISAIIGTILEFLAGYGFYKVFNSKVWTYKEGALGKYTSIYAIPYWGGAGVMFALLAKILGL